MEDNRILEKDYTEEETGQQVLENESTLLEGLLAAADYASNEELTLNITRKGKRYFSFTVHPIPEDMMQEIRKKYTRYEKNRKNGMITSEELDVAKFRSSVIYNSTVEADKERIWDNKQLWEGLRRQGKNIINALDVIEAVLIQGEKERIMRALDQLCGYDEEELIETAKN